MRSVRLLLWVMLSSSAMLHAQNWADPSNWDKISSPLETKDVIYVAADTPDYSAKEQLLDVYQNAASSPKNPVLVYMHGGAWNHGKRPQSWTAFRPWIAAGFSVVNVEYRMADAHPAPAAIQDVRCVLSWLNQNAAKYHFDTLRIVTYGTSAGGHLALLAAVLPRGNTIDPPQCTSIPHVAAVLDFYGPYHLEPSTPGAFTSPSTKRWMGPNPQPSLEAKEHQMSPSTYIRAGIPPVFIAHGDADPVVPYLSSETLKADLDKAGVMNVLDTVHGGQHGKWPPEESQRVQLDSLRFLQSVGVIR